MHLCWMLALAAGFGMAAAAGARPVTPPHQVNFAAGDNVIALQIGADALSRARRGRKKTARSGTCWRSPTTRCVRSAG